MIARLNLVLLLAVIGTAMYLVHVEYRSRQLYTQYYKVQSEARALQVEYERLQVEKRAQATPLRIERLAKEQIRMRTTTPATTLYVRPDGSVLPLTQRATPAAPASPGARRQP